MINLSNLLLLIIVIVIAIALTWPLRISLILKSGLTLIIAVLFTWLYWLFGGASVVHEHNLQKIKEQQVKSILATPEGVNGLIAQMKAKLQAEPTAKGWFLLGRLYASQGKWQNARKNFNKACLLEIQNSEYQIAWIESVWNSNNQSLTASSRETLTKLIKKYPTNPDIIIWAARDAYEQENYQQAIDYWRKLQKMVAPNSKTSLSIQQAIEHAKYKMK